MGNFMHHFMGITSYGCTVFSQHNYNLMALNLLPGELTGANMHIRDIFRRIGWRYTMTFYANDYIYAFGYIVLRLTWLPAVYYWIWPCPTANPCLVIMYPIHVVQSWYYILKLPKMIKERNVERAMLTKAGLKIKWFDGIPLEKVKEIKLKNYEPFEM